MSPLTRHGKPVEIDFYGTREIRAILGIGKEKALEIMHGFEYRGQCHRIGRLMKVRKSVFEHWVEQQKHAPASAGRR